MLWPPRYPESEKALSPEENRKSEIKRGSGLHISVEVYCIASTGVLPVRTVAVEPPTGVVSAVDNSTRKAPDSAPLSESFSSPTGAIFDTW